LDKRTKGEWVLSSLEKIIQRDERYEKGVVLVDAVRIESQIEAIRAAYGQSVLHVHLEAPHKVLENRFRKRSAKVIKESESYSKVQENETERQVVELKNIADVVIDTKRCSVDDVVTRVASRVGLYGRGYLRLVDVMVGGQYGSEGKGQIAAYLANEYDYLVRVGGPNAGHTVYLSPSPYVFHHLPSGTRSNPNARLVVGAGSVIYVPTICKEIAECAIDCERLSIDPQAMIITEKDRKAESRLRDNIGSTAQGVGMATARKIMGRASGVVLARDVKALKPFIRDTRRVLEEAFRQRQRVFLEGTQGTGLSLHHGHYPYVTSRDTTVAGCLAEAGISPSRVGKVLMVCRTYPIRVQSPAGNTSGPMSQELSWSEISRRSGIRTQELKSHEMTSTTHRQRRVCEFDWALLRKAATLNAPTDIALTFTDYLSVLNRNARRFDQLDTETILFVEEIEQVAAAPVSLISTRFHDRSIIDRRSW
jgi:adenylosuccinate synthase